MLGVKRSEVKTGGTRDGRSGSARTSAVGRARRVAAAADDGGSDDEGVGLLLNCPDGTSHYVSRESLELSGYLKRVLESFPGEDSVEIVASGDVVSKLVAYLDHYGSGGMPRPRPILRPLRHPTMAKNCDKWDAMFIDRVYEEGNQQLLDLLSASMVLEIQPLFDLCSAKVASLVKGNPYHVVKTNLDTLD